MSKDPTTNPAVQAYARQQRAGLLAGKRPQTAYPPEQPMSAVLGTLRKTAVQWIAQQAPEVRPEEREREALALVGDFLSLVRRNPLPHVSCQEQFLEYLDGAPPPRGNLEN